MVKVIVKCKVCKEQGECFSGGAGDWLENHIEKKHKKDYKNIEKLRKKIRCLVKEQSKIFERYEQEYEYKNPKYR